MFLCLLFCLARLAVCLQYMEHTVLKYEGQEDPGQPLILTPYINSGDIDQGVANDYMIITDVIIHTYS